MHLLALGQHTAIGRTFLLYKLLYCLVQQSGIYYISVKTRFMAVVHCSRMFDKSADCCNELQRQYLRLSRSRMKKGQLSQELIVESSGHLIERTMLLRTCGCEDKECFEQNYKSKMHEISSKVANSSRWLYRWETIQSRCAALKGSLMGIWSMNPRKARASLLLPTAALAQVANKALCGNKLAK